jgi:hypothetical protein
MTYRFSPEARIDLLAAADYYETQRSGLGSEFAVDVGSALARVLEAPQRWPEKNRESDAIGLTAFRRRLSIASAQAVDIIALFHLRRRPGSWRRNRRR